MDYSFHVYNKLSADGVTMATENFLGDFLSKNKKKRGAGTSLTQISCLEPPLPPPVVVCVGSDLAIGDSLGPIVGSMLKYKTQGLNFFLYGTLAAPVTAKEIKYTRSFLQKTHPDSPIIAVDAAVGEKGDIGLIRVTNHPLFPGAGANKQLGELGDVSILGIVAEKSITNYGILNTTRLNLVYTMSEIISEGLSALLWNYRQNQNIQLKNA
jgi:putative sporulation protein YyaC